MFVKHATDCRVERADCGVGVVFGRDLNFRAVGTFERETLSCHVRETEFNRDIRLRADVEVERVVVGLVLCADNFLEIVDVAIDGFANVALRVDNAQVERAELIVEAD